jgi:hypothetical protein
VAELAAQYQDARRELQVKTALFTPSGR